MDAVQFSRIVSPELLALPGSPDSQKKTGEFADVLREGLNRLDELEKDSAELSRQLMAGEPVELHRVVMASEQAGLAFDLLMSVRNKAVDAYQEVMRMQV